MKKSSTLFLQTVIVLLGIGVLAFMLLEPRIEGRNAHATLFQTYFNDPFLVYAYTASIAFFVALSQAFKVLGYVRQNKIFSQATVKAFRTIKYCAIALVVLIVAPVAYLCIVLPGDDIAGGVAMGLFLIFISVVVAAAAAVFEGVLQQVKKDTTASEEILQCFDDQGNPTEGLPRSDVKTKPYRWWYGVSSIWVLSKDGMLLCSKRSEQLRNNQGKWQTYFGGHVAHQYSFEENALKELREECGLRVKREDLFLIEEGRKDTDHHFFKKYAVVFQGKESDIQFTDGEVTEVRWMTMDQYWKEKEEYPDHWCNRFLPQHQQRIMELNLIKGIVSFSHHVY